MPSLQETHSPLTHEALPPNRLEYLISCAFTPRPITQNLHHDLYGRCVVMCSWCSLAVGWPGSQMFLNCVLPPSNPISPVLHDLVVCFTVQLVSILNVRRSPHTVTFSSFLTALIQLRSFSFSSLGPVAHYSCRQNIWLLQSNVTRLLGSLPSATSLIASTSVGVYTMGAVTLGGTLTNRSSTCTFPSFLSIDFSFFFLFMMHASSFPMNKSFPAWMMCDADTRGLLTSATCHVLLHTNPSGVLTDMTCCP